ncbi:MAG: aldehyde dehydrogenase family protein, partial [Candidatus Dormibacteraeota bacterium]|nr:aldehyde dehydrogenase family protein [Candidatus Dormibacteraeota bacterium]
MSKGTLEVLEPATEAVLEALPRAEGEDVDAAVAAAQAAFGAWRAIAPAARAEHLRALADSLQDAREELALLEARNAGKPIADAESEIGMVIDTFRYYSGAPERLLGETIPAAGGQAFTVREPLGVVGLIVP